MKMKCVYCEVRSEFFKVMYKMSFILQIGKVVRGARTWLCILHGCEWRLMPHLCIAIPREAAEESGAGREL